jgi:hypothetical protein
MDLQFTTDHMHTSNITDLSASLLYVSTIFRAKTTHVYVTNLKTGLMATIVNMQAVPR